MNLTKAEKVRLGAFLITGGAVLVGSLTILAGLRLTEDRAVYYTSFEESVTGLEPSAAVRYQGLRVGRVDRLQVDPDDPAKIRVTLSLGPDTVLYEGTHAVLDMSGLTGLKTVNLSPGDPRKAKLEPGHDIPAEASLVGKIGDRAETISARVELVASNLAKWTGPDNRRRVEAILDRTEALLTHVDALVVETKDPLVGALDEVARTGKSVRGVSDEATLTMRELRGDLKATLVAARKTLDETNRILAAVDTDSVRGTVASASAAMAALDRNLRRVELGRTLAELQVALTELTRLAQNLDLTVRASREDLVLSLKYVRQATEDLREFSRIIAQDPSVLIRGTEVSE